MIVVKNYICSETCENPESTPVHITKNQVKETFVLAYFEYSFPG